jgi:Leucine-rich repeat (LRR) protein
MEKLQTWLKSHGLEYTIDELKNLKELDLEDMGIYNIEDDIFVGMENLEFLNLSENRLNSLNKNSFNGLKNLKMLNLSYNRFIDILVDDFNNLDSLEVLDLSSNIIAVINSSAIDKLKSLKILNLEDNELENIDDKIYKDDEIETLKKLLVKESAKISEESIVFNNKNSKAKITNFVSI